MVVFHNAATLRNEDIFRQHTNFHGSLGMSIQSAVLTLNREEVLRLQQVNHELQITRICVTRHPQVLGNQLDNAPSLINHIFYTSHDRFLGN